MMLTFNPNRRANVETALNHPFLESIRRKEKEVLLIFNIFLFHYVLHCITKQNAPEKIIMDFEDMDLSKEDLKGNNCF